MADGKGSSSGTGAGGDFMGGLLPDEYQSILASLQGAPSPVAQNVHQQQHNHNHYDISRLIEQPAPMAAPLPLPYAPQLTDLTPPPPPPTEVFAQSTNNLPPAGAGGYQYWPVGGSHNEVAAQQVPNRSDYLDWEMYNSTYMPVACGTSSSNVNINSISNNNVYNYQGLMPTSSTSTNTTWSNYMMKNDHYSSGYSTLGVLDLAHQQAPSLPSSSQVTNSGYLARFGLDQPLVSSPSYPPMSPVGNNGSSSQFFNVQTTNTKRQKREAIYTQNMNYSEDTPDMDSENSDEKLDHTVVANLANLSQNYESLNASFSCRGYHMIVRKELTNSDVGNIGRMVVPKRDAEANLPVLYERDGIILKMDDFKLPVTWRFKYRYWPNNKSRMYILETTGEFVKSHGLEAGDTIAIYQSSQSYKYLVRGVKATQLYVSPPCPECKERNSVDQCGFSMMLHARRRT